MEIPPTKQKRKRIGIRSVKHPIFSAMKIPGAFSFLRKECYESIVSKREVCRDRKASRRDVWAEGWAKQPGLLSLPS